MLHERGDREGDESKVHENVEPVALATALGFRR